MSEATTAPSPLRSITQAQADDLLVFHTYVARWHETEWDVPKFVGQRSVADAIKAHLSLPYVETIFARYGDDPRAVEQALTRFIERELGR